MLNKECFSKTVAGILLISVFLTGCDVPDISEFTTQSAEMTRGIRKGVKDTGDALKTAAENDGLFEPQTIADFKKHSKSYNTAMQQTLETLDALDSYLDALNTLRQANRKSAENSKALVGAVDNLVSSASKLVIAPPTAALELPEMALRIGTGVIAAAEQFRTAKSFRNRVNAAAELVEGKIREVNREVLIDGKAKTITEYKKVCTIDKKSAIESIGRRYAEKQKSLISDVEKAPNYQKLEDESAKKEFLITVLAPEFKKAEREVSDELNQAGCGVIDLLIFTMQDLRRINQDVASLTERNFIENNRTTFNLYQGIDNYNTRVQREITHILDYKTYLSKIKEEDFKLLRSSGEEKTQTEKRISNYKQTLRFKLSSIYRLDSQIITDLEAKISECDAPAINGRPAKTKCAGMMQFITCMSCLGDRNELTEIINRISKSQFDHGNGLIETVLNARVVDLFNENERYLTERERIKPDFDRINTELGAIRTSQKKLDKLLVSSSSALNTWAATHANLRVTVNTKKTLSVATLAAKVKEIWAALETDETD
ncbi:MAG: hypothetical protein KF762_18415 [Acidobacteria bacterium]|nr:hypothetical protein [Acidobacteriota bacterium]